MKHPLKILLLEDNSTDAEIIQRMLSKEKGHCEFKLTMDKKSFVQAIHEFSPDIILSDNSLPQFNALEALKITRSQYLHIPFILVTGTVSDEYAADVIKHGADDYILKDRLTRLPAAIDAALRQRQAEKEKLEAAEKLKQSEENYRTITERLSDAFVALDKNWRYTYVNKKAGEILRRQPDELIGKNTWTEFPEGVDLAVYKAYHKAMETQQYIHFEEYYTPFGVWLENHIYPSKDGLSVFIRDITETKKLETKLQKQQREEQSKLIAAALEAQEKERNAIGIELHDNVNQILVGVKLYLSMMKKDSVNNLSFVGTCLANIQQAIDENRKIAHSLVTPDFETIKLTERLSELTDNMLRSSGLIVHFETSWFSETKLDDEQKLIAYRIAQEQFTNIVKYANAKLVTISLSIKNDFFTMTIADDGKGMEEGKKITGIGLRNIKGRLSIVNGNAVIKTASGKGFSLEIIMPLKNE